MNMKAAAPLTRQDALYLDHLRTITQAKLQSVLRGRDEVAYVGVPRHRNLGDSMIAGGTTAYLGRIGVKIKYMCDLNGLDMSVIRSLPPTMPILLHGGGNLGDLYPHEEAFRLRIIAENLQRRFVVLPQTIHFRHDDNLEMSAQVYDSARDLTVMVRDRESEAFAAKSFSDTQLVWSPDHALGWTPILRNVSKRQPVIIARSDDESMPADRGIPAKDWTFSLQNEVVWRASTYAGSVVRRMPSSDRLAAVASRIVSGQTTVNLRAAQEIASRASGIATNRLHVHILSCLSGVPNFVADNSYGKVSRIFDEYTGEFSTATWSESLSRAVRFLQ